MKKKIKRGHAIRMYAELNKLALGKLSEEMLEAVMDNIIALEKHATQFEKMMQELGRRLYEGFEQGKIETFNEKLTKAQRAKDAEKRLVAVDAVKAEYPELFALLSKQIKVEASLKDKDIEVEFSIVNRKAFCKDMVRGNQNLPFGLLDIFNPMFEVDEDAEKEEDFSELDEFNL